MGPRFQTLNFTQTSNLSCLGKPLYLKGLLKKSLSAVCHLSSWLDGWDGLVPTKPWDNSSPVHDPESCAVETSLFLLKECPKGEKAGLHQLTGTASRILSVEQSGLGYGVDLRSTGHCCSVTCLYHSDLEAEGTQVQFKTNLQCKFPKVYSDMCETSTALRCIA